MAINIMTVSSFRIDTHAHVFDRRLKLAPGRRYAPEYDAPLDAYLRQLDENGLTHGVLVQPSFLGTDNSYLLDCLKAADGRLRGIVVIDPGISLEQLAAYDEAGVVGIRLNLVGQPLPDFSTQEWRDLLATLKSLDWQIEIQRNAADLVPLAQMLADNGVNVVVDHFGLPDPKLGIADPGFRGLLELGSSGRVYVKLSAPYRNGPEGRNFARQAYPLLRHAFGLDHLMWGSDWPHTQHEAAQAYAGNLAFLDELAMDESEKSQILAMPRNLFKY
ncbi:amidohydrolase family protein [Rhizobium sp. ICMP 5592]|uniref:amidohydrolase family protein n=1 Tax=Rhizobium sp. ICMP 5592 TaxID=2292445 RepID=UPI002570CC4A|nr:amidohydrolase family protein [Rhizobium sp. ICMP 5592]